MSSLLEMWNDIQKVLGKVDKIVPITRKTFEIIYNKSPILRCEEDKLPPIYQIKEISNLTGEYYLYTKKFEKERDCIFRQVLDEHNIQGGNEKRKEYQTKWRKGNPFKAMGTEEELYWEARQLLKVKAEFEEDYLPHIYERYKITQEENDALNLKLKSLWERYENAKAKQQQEHLEMREEKKAKNKINRLKKQNDIKTFCECCNKAYASRNFKTHLESEKHKKNASACEKQTDTDEV